MLLPANPVFRFYKGGAGIDRFRGVEPGSGPGAPEDWVASTTTSFGSDTEGLAALPDGRILRDVIAADPSRTSVPSMSRSSVPTRAYWSSCSTRGSASRSTSIPDRGFAKEHLHSDFGKTEAWLILEAEPGAHMHLGLREPIDLQTLRRWATEQDSDVMLQALHKVPVSAGDALFVPAGTLHTIGSGITLIELQEPSDMSVVVEWRNAGVTNGDEHLQLGWETVLPAADIGAAAPIHVPARRADPSRSSLKRLLPPEADPYFRAERLRCNTDRAAPAPAAVLDPDRHRGELTLGSEVRRVAAVVTGYCCGDSFWRRNDNVVWRRHGDPLPAANGGRGGGQPMSVTELAPILEARNIVKTYGHVNALRGRELHRLSGGGRRADR